MSCTKPTSLGYSDIGGAKNTCEPQNTDRIARGQYFGGTLQSSREHSGIVLSEVEYDTVRKCATHTHGRAFFALLLRGQYSETLPRSSLIYKRFDLAFHPEATKHADEVRAVGTRFFLIELEKCWVDRLREYSPRTSLEPQICDHLGSMLATRLYGEHRQHGLSSPLTIEGIILEMLSRLVPNPAATGRQKPRWLRSVLDLLEGEYRRNLTVAEIARKVDLHPVYLSRAFREFCGQSPGQYLNRVRVRYAQEKLANPEIPISEIALLAGFFDQSHFTRVFKQQTGITPGAFRALSIKSP
jgi:AraC family transcriptional regulator